MAMSAAGVENGSLTRNRSEVYKKISTFFYAVRIDCNVTIRTIPPHIPEQPWRQPSVLRGHTNMSHDTTSKQDR